MGRWSVLIGARAPRDTWLDAKRKALMYDARIYRRAMELKGRVRSLVP